MMVRIRVSCVLTSVVIGLALAAGCSQGVPEPSAPAAASAESPASSESTGEYNPHDVPITDEQKQQLREQAGDLSKAVEVIKELRNATEEETKNGIPQNPHNAHQALDKADLVFQWLPEIARDSAVPKEYWEEITTTANDLRTLFEKVHQNIDNKREPDFASVAGEVDQKIARLAEIAQAQPSAKSEPQP